MAMQQLFFFVAICCSLFISYSNFIELDPFELTPLISIPDTAPVKSEPIGIQSISQFNLRSNTVTDQKNESTNNYWKGGIILTSESNKQSTKGRSETTIASTRCGNIIFVGFNSAQGFCDNNPPNHAWCPGVPDGFQNSGCSYSVSLDAGKTWTYMYGPPSLDTDIYGRNDPWLSMGGKSSKNKAEMLYFSCLAMNGTAYGEHLGLSVHVARIIYQHNNPRKKAINFEWIRVSLIRKKKVDDFLDKEAIAADPIDADKAYISLKRFDNAGPQGIEVYATHDTGISWQGPVVLQERIANIVSQFTYPVVSGNGDIYVIWWEWTAGIDNFLVSLRYRFVRSTDGGTTFSSPININPEYINFNPFTQPPISHNRQFLQPQPTMDVFTSSIGGGCKQNRNRIIVAYQYGLSDAYNSGDLQGFIDDNSTVLNSLNIGISYSDDRGINWHFIDPFKYPIHQRFVKRIFPSVSVSLDGESVNIVYLEINEIKKPEFPICKTSWNVRTSLYHDIVDTYYIHSGNGGIDWSDPIKLNEESVDWCTVQSFMRPNYGDYMLSISDLKGGVQIAGITNGFTEVDTTSTAVDVIYYHHRCVKNMEICNNDNQCCDKQTKCIYHRCRRNMKQWEMVNNAVINEEHKGGHWISTDLENGTKNIDNNMEINVILLCIICLYLK